MSLDLIVKNFFAEVDEIENSSIFLNDDICEPKTEWLEEIDSRTNFPFYWNSNSKESVWDMPKEYNEYLISYEAYLRDLILKSHEAKKSEMNNDNSNNLNDMKGLIEYSDSEDEALEEIAVEEIQDNALNENDNTKIPKVEEEETEENLLIKKEKWMSEQADEAEKYLKNLIKKMSETIKNKVQSLCKNNLATEQLKELSIRVMTRLEDWSEGHLSLEREVDKLQEALIEVARFEASLKADRSRMNWNDDMSRYLCTDVDPNQITVDFCESKNSFEEGEIIEDDDDLALDLEEYVSTTLHERRLVNNDDDRNYLANENTMPFNILLDTNDRSPKSSPIETESTLQNQLVQYSPDENNDPDTRSDFEHG